MEIDKEFTGAVLRNDYESFVEQLNSGKELYMDIVDTAFLKCDGEDFRIIDEIFKTPQKKEWYGFMLMLAVRNNKKDLFTRIYKTIQDEEILKHIDFSLEIDKIEPWFK